MPNSPRVSVLMPVHNAERYIKAALTSVLSQTIGNDIEVIVVDDASTDSSPSIVRQFKDTRVRLLLNDSPCGVASSLNRALEEVNAPLVARMDADDICHPDRFRRQLTFLQSHPDIGVLSTWCKVIDAHSQVIGQVKTPQTHEIISFTLYILCPIIHPSVMMRTSILREASGYNIDMPYAQDYELWLRLAPSVRMSSLSEYLLLYRRHPFQVGERLKGAQRHYSGRAWATAVSALLDREIPDSFSSWWNCFTTEEPPETERAALAVAALLTDVVEAFIHRRKLDSNSAHLIRREGSGWLLKLARLCTRALPGVVPEVFAAARALRAA